MYHTQTTNYLDTRTPSPLTMDQKRLGSTVTDSEDLGTGVSLEMVNLPSGAFQMGSFRPDSEEDSYLEQPQHWVSVTSFHLGKFPVTQEQWAKVADLPKVAIDLDSRPSFCRGSQHPVESVSWYEAIEFCARLSKQTGKLYRLPSEAEWEYACRAGTQTDYHFGSIINPQLANYSCFGEHSNRRLGLFAGQTTPVGYFEANNFGLYDLHGNVWEWCSDPWHERYRAFLFQNAPKDGRVWDGKDNDCYYDIVENIHQLLKSQHSRVSRGGSWFNSADFCRSACRHQRDAASRLGNLGFRVCYST